MNVSVIGLGAMGGGMARSLLRSNATTIVKGYDLSPDLVAQFREEAAAVGKDTTTTHDNDEDDTTAPSSSSSVPSLRQVVTSNTDVVIVVLVNESQCNKICFGENDTDNDGNDGADTSTTTNLTTILRPGSCVIICSTVTASWCRSSHTTFTDHNIRFVDCPISGGPIRSLAGELTLMVAASPPSSGDPEFVRPLLEAMGSEIHIIEGGPGAGSTVKMVHQLLAGVHIVVAAEALALAAKAGLDVVQMYEIVCGAAGASWMFGDRGKRMVGDDDDDGDDGKEKKKKKVMSALALFLKDMDIVHSEAKRLECPIPMASAALQQFIAGASLGLAREDDSQVVRVYEALSGVKVRNRKRVSQTTSEQQHSSPSQQELVVSDKIVATTPAPAPAPAPPVQKEGNAIGDIWKLPDGTHEKILEVGDEPYHKTILSNRYTRVLRVQFPADATTLAHRHAEDSLYFFLVPGGLDVVNHIKGSDPACDCMGFGEVRYGTHRTDTPLVHRITNRSGGEMLCVDAEVLAPPPVTSPIPLVAKCHELVKVRDRCRVYRLVLEPGERVEVSYTFFYLSVVLKGAVVKMEVGCGEGRSVAWPAEMVLGDVEWKSPVVGLVLTNTGETVFEQYIAEWC